MEPDVGDGDGHRPTLPATIAIMDAAPLPGATGWSKPCGTVTLRDCFLNATNHNLPFADTLTLAVLAGVLAAACLGQVEAEIEALEVRRDEIGIELDQIDTDLALTEAELEVLDRERVTAEVQIELTADDLERAVDSRREPASTRVAIALVGFTQGDPRENALLDEVLALQGSDENTRARELYTAAIDDAQTRLERAEASIRDVARRLDEDRALLADVIGRQQTAEQLRSELGQRRADLTVNSRRPSPASNCCVPSRTRHCSPVSPPSTPRPGRLWPSRSTM